MKAIPLIKQLNWVDLFFLILLMRIIYIGIKKGLVVEFFKTLGVILSLFLSLHYYTRLGDFIHAKSSLPLEFADFVSFVFLVMIGYLLFLILRTAFLLLIKVEPVNLINRWGGAILGILRGILTVSLLISVLCLSTIKYFEESSKKSFSSNYLSRVAPKTYEFIFKNLFVKFASQERFNEAIFEVLE